LSFARLIAPCQERIYRLAMRITRNCEDAEDVQQETLLKVHRKQIQFESRSQFSTWVCRIAINEALMCLRRRRGASHVPLEEAFCLAEDTVAKEDFHSPIESPEAAYSRKELRNLLTRAVENLHPLHRTVFLLRAVEQFSTSETAKVLKISTSAVKVRLLRARSELRDYLKQASTNHSNEFPNGQPAV
jgi:RNA polymerase sigma-70 factor, ECF subfamily